jgi:hypothetical protein
MALSAELHGPVALLTGKELPAPAEQGTDGPHSWSGHFGKAKGFLPLPEVIKVQPVG